MKTLRIIFCVAAVSVAGCAGLTKTLDAVFDPAQNTEADGTPSSKSKAQEGAEIVDGFLPDPWGEIVLSTILLAQNAYLGTRTVQKRRAAKKAATEA